MKLVKLKLKNFRCYQKETYFLIDDLTTIIGKNDIGKSTILEALDCFFNDKIDQSDLSNNADNNSVEVTCCFENIPDQIILDTTVPTSPTEEGILNKENQLEIKKVFSFAARKSIAIFIVGNYPNDPRLSKLLSMKNSALKNYAEELTVDLEGINKTKNPPIRKKIRDFIGGERTITEFKVDGNVDAEDNLKAIWSSLKNKLPVYSLFKVDKKLDDKDGDIQDPMKLAVSEALALPEIQELLDQVEAKVKAASTAVADKTIEKLKDFDEAISERLKSDFNKNPTYDKIFDLTLLNENNIPLNKRGSGIRRLVLLSFFQAQAEKRKAEDNSPAIIYAIEEPETSQHPNHQKMLIDSLIRLSEQQNVQVLFSTHSANLVREIPIHALRYISLDDQGNINIESGENIVDGSENEAVILKIINTLGILPNPADRIKVLLYVEGNHDVNALKRYSNIINANDPEILNLSSSKAVGYVITGGSALKHYIEQKHLEGLGKPEVHIYDNDVAEYKTAVAKINSETNPKKVAFNTTKLELENYLHHDAILEAYAENGLNTLVLNPIDNNHDVPLLVAEQVYIAGGGDWTVVDLEKRKEFASDKKKLLNTKAVEKMTIDRIIERGGYDEICLWLNTIKQFTS
jgi:putative ATP-dependent endonuclease of the OLD family